MWKIGSISKSIKDCLRSTPKSIFEGNQAISKRVQYVPYSWQFYQNTAAHLIFVTTATTGGGVLFSSRRTFLNRERGRYANQNTKYANQNTKYVNKNTKYANQITKYANQNTKYAK